MKFVPTLPASLYNVKNLICQHTNKELLMRRLIFLFSSAILLTLSSAALAEAGYGCPAGMGCNNADKNGSFELQSNQVVQDPDGYQRTGHEMYFYTGYEYDYAFLTNSNQTVTNGNLPSISYNASTSNPNSFNGFEIGIGKALSMHTDLQLAYLQFFTSSNASTINGQSSTVYQKIQGLKGDVAIIINPQDAFQVGVSLGARLYQYYQTSTIGGTNYYPQNDSTVVNPDAGLQLAYHFTNNFSALVNTDYTFNPNSQISDGDLTVLVGMGYTL